MICVYLLAAGEGGPILLGNVDHKALTRRIHLVQTHNAAVMQVVELLDGDERLERELHVAFSAAGLHVRGDWYQAGAVEAVPANTPRVKRTPMSEDRRLAAQRMADRVTHR